MSQPQGRPGEKGEIGPIVSQFVTINRVVTVPCNEVSHLHCIFRAPPAHKAQRESEERQGGQGHLEKM